MVGQSEQLIQDKNKNVMKAIIGIFPKILFFVLIFVLF
jgi:hypothetical protein